jgi:hypothetical protein
VPQAVLTVVVAKRRGLGVRAPAPEALSHAVGELLVVLVHRSVHERAS